MFGCYTLAVNRKIKHRGVLYLSDICIFKRIEKKYRITTQQKEALLAIVGKHLKPDEYGKSTICSIYLDTPNYRLIRNSIEAISYKEKIRLRSYGVPKENTKVFLELKKKYKGVVYKRRISMTLKQAMDYLENGVRPEESQIMREIDYSMKFYDHPTPSIYIAYEREAFYAEDIPSLRITFDSNVRYRGDNLLLQYGDDGKKLIKDNELLLEIKTDGAMPLWLSSALTECGILPSSFSKCGTAYQILMGKTPTQYIKGELSYARS